MHNTFYITRLHQWGDIDGVHYITIAKHVLHSYIFSSSFIFALIIFQQFSFPIINFSKREETFTDPLKNIVLLIQRLVQALRNYHIISCFSICFSH